MTKRPCYIISKGFQNPLVYPGVDVDLKMLDKGSHVLVLFPLFEESKSDCYYAFQA